MKEVQYPSVQAPPRVAVVVAPTFFECDSVQIWSLRRAQQPNSYVGPVMVITTAAAPTWFEASPDQRFPRRFTQQLSPIVSAPVMKLARRRWAWVS